MSFRRNRLILCLGVLALTSTQAIAVNGILASWLIGKVIDGVVLPRGKPIPKQLGPENTQELASLLNQDLPQKAGDGLILAMALPAGRSAIEMRHVSEKFESIENLSERLDKKVAPALLREVCSDQGARMWMFAGGEFLFTYYLREGRMARSYSAAAQDCGIRR